MLLSYGRYIGPVTSSLQKLTCEAPAQSSTRKGRRQKGLQEQSEDIDVGHR